MKDRRPTLSPSKITTYLACPAKYYWSYVNPRGRWYMRSRSTYSFGSTLHKVLERFHDTSDRGVETIYEAVAAVEENWLDAGYGSVDEMNEAMGEGKAMIAAYADELLRLPPTAKTVAVEKMLRLDMGPFDLIGRIDRIDEHEDGTLEIIDYKTGRSAATEDELRADIPMNSYQLLVRAAYPERPVRSTLIALRNGERVTVEPSEDELAEFRFSLFEIGQEMLNRNWDEYAAYLKGLCRSCDFLRLCRKHPEFEGVE